MTFPTHKANSMGVVAYSPGPDLDSGPAAGIQVRQPAAAIPTYLTARIASGMTTAAPVQQFTPDQQAFRNSVADGRWQADYNVGAHAPLYRMTQDPATGAFDVVYMDCYHSDNAADQYVDLGGQGGRDFAARRP